MPRQLRDNRDRIDADRRDKHNLLVFRHLRPMEGAVRSHLAIFRVLGHGAFYMALCKRRNNQRGH